MRDFQLGLERFTQPTRRKYPHTYLDGQSEVEVLDEAVGAQQESHGAGLGHLNGNVIKLKCLLEDFFNKIVLL